MAGMTDSAAVELIRTAQTSLGIEFGSTRIKAALTGSGAAVLAGAEHEWQNRFEDGFWTYPENAIWNGLQDCYRQLASAVRRRYGVPLATVGAIGVSGMMHGYLALDAQGNLLTPFRTWRNTTTGQAAAELTELFQFNVPQRWSVAHLYQSVLNNEPHVPEIASLNTLAGYVHERLTGCRVLGVGDASGMFPIDAKTKTYCQAMVAKFDQLAARQATPLELGQLLPGTLPAGAPAGRLTVSGARLLDPSGALAPGIPLCAPEGDAGTGMVATNAVAPRTGNVSVGTSIFAMIVLDKALTELHTEIDMVTTPEGKAVAMVHCNNGASELDQWASVFLEFATAIGAQPSPDQVFETLFRASLAGDPDAGGLTAFNNLAGEPITGLADGRPLFLRAPDSRLNLANFARAQVFAVFATLQLGMRILAREGVGLDSMFAHGGVFKTKGVAQRLLAAALGAPVTVSDTADQGGPWGMAILAAYLKARDQNVTLTDYLNQEVFANIALDTVEPDPADVAGCRAFLQRYVNALPVMRQAIDHT
jgi:sugar (pentulose or hexulose) kinase